MRPDHARLLARHLLLAFFSYSAVAQAPPPNTHFPYPEKLTYLVEWRLINAGTATVQLARDNPTKGWDLNVHIESAGLVSRLYRVVDSYKVATTDRFCAVNASLEAQEGKKHALSRFTVDSARKKVVYEEHELVKNTSEKKELDVPPCTYEITGALAALRGLNLEPGRSVVIPITDGKKFAQGRILAQAKEKISVNGKSYGTTRYEAYLFDNVLYRRHGRLLIWISDDPDHVPVQFRLLLGFPIGTVTVSLQKQEH